MVLKIILENKPGQDNYHCLNTIAEILLEKSLPNKKFLTELGNWFFFPTDANYLIFKIVCLVG